MPFLKGAWQAKEKVSRVFLPKAASAKSRAGRTGLGEVALAFLQLLLQHAPWIQTFWEAAANEEEPRVLHLPDIPRPGNGAALPAGCRARPEGADPPAPTPGARLLRG